MTDNRISIIDILMKLSRRNFLKFSIGTGALAGSTSALAKAAEETKIPKRKFGRHDDELTVVGFGGHTLYYAGSQKEANAIVDRAVDLGVNFFENAWDYHGGTAETYMGNALEGKRDKVFLMTKFCNYHQSKEKATVALAMKNLEDSLRRLKTDHLDLWMMHNVSGDDAEDAYKTDGAIEAMELARKQGKIRYTGFTGHTDAKVHRALIEGGYEWDATLMPVSILGALRSREFETDTMPLCEEKNIAVLGMKGFGGSRRTHLHSQTNPEQVLSYALSYPQVCCHVIGVDKVEYVDQAVAASTVIPMKAMDRALYVVDEVGDADALAHGGKLYERDACCGRDDRSHA